MRVHSFESLAARDGSGLRYAVFLAGCPLRCVYCHNPDSWSAESGTEYTTEQIAKKILRCKPYLKAGKGGVTFSGGEPLLQAEELYRLITRLQSETITSCIDTSGCVALDDAVRNALLASESILLDLKFCSENTYKAYTNGNLQQVMQTLDFLVQNNKSTKVRTVIVPGLNDNESALEKYAKLLAPYKHHLNGWELLPFHTLGFFKYEQLQIRNPLIDTPPLPKETLHCLQATADRLLY